MNQITDWLSLWAGVTIWISLGIAWIATCGPEIKEWQNKRKIRVKNNQPLDLSLWQGRNQYKLGDAACLWVNVSPHNPITDERAKAKYSELWTAVKTRQLRAPEDLGSRARASFVVASDGQYEGEISYNTTVSAKALREYAESIGDVPRFLEKVEYSNP